MDAAQIIIVFLTTLPATLAALAALIAAMRNANKIDENTKLTKTVKDDVAESKEAGKTEAAEAVKTTLHAVQASTEAVAEVAKSINGKMDDRIEEVRRLAFSEGVLQGKQIASEHAKILAANTEQVRINTDKIVSLARHDEKNRENLKVLREAIEKLTLESIPAAAAIAEIEKRHDERNVE
jgi:hypothetical protein